MSLACANEPGKTPVYDRKDCLLLLRRQKIPALLGALSLLYICSVPAKADRSDISDINTPTESVELPVSRITGEAATAPAAKPALPPSRLSRTPVDRSAAMVRTALSMRGARYRFGGTGRGGFDCSGFVSHLYRTAKGVKLPRTAAQQSRVGKAVSRADLKPGDLLFFRTRGLRVGHVGMYVGNDKMVHAANPRSGVKTDQVFGGYWGKRLVAIRRPGG